MKYGIHLWVLTPLALGLVIQGTAFGSDWICYRGSPERIGSSGASAPDTCYLLWQLNIGPKLFASPVVRDGKVFQVGLENLYCADLETGEVLWVSITPVYQSTPFLTDKEIIVATDRGISALSVTDGSTIWEYMVKGRFREVMPLRDYIISSPVVSEDKVVVGTMTYYYVPAESPLTVPDEMYIVCLGEETGEEQWYVETTLGVRTSPCIAHQKVFAASREMLCISLKTGDMVWNSEHTYPYDIEKPVKERFTFFSSTPALYHGILVAGTASNVVLVDSGTGGPALLQPDSGAVYLAYRKSNSSLYVTSNSGSGWSTPVQTTGVASGDPAFLQTETEIVLIYKGTDNYCYRISSSDGVNWSSPSQIAPNKIVSDPASVQRTDRSYRVTAQYISASALDLMY